MEAGRHEVRAQGMHLDQRQEVPGIAKVIGVLAAAEARAGRRLDGDDPRLRSAAKLLADKGKSDAGEVRAAAGAADDDVRVVTGHLHLRHGLHPDHRLVEDDVVQHGAERIAGVVPAPGDLDRLGHGKAEGTAMVRLLGEHRPPDHGVARRQATQRAP